MKTGDNDHNIKITLDSREKKASAVIKKVSLVSMLRT